MNRAQRLAFSEPRVQVGPEPAAPVERIFQRVIQRHGETRTVVATPSRFLGRTRAVLYRHCGERMLLARCFTKCWCGCDRDVQCGRYFLCSRCGPVQSLRTLSSVCLKR